MILTLPLQETEQPSDVDYTTVDEIKFLKKMSGKERAEHIASVFASHYRKDKTIGHRAQTYNEFYVKIDSDVYVSLRGYKHIVVCIVGTSYANFGPNGRMSANRNNSLFEEEKNVFPFKAVLDRVRVMTRLKEEKKRQEDLVQQERDFKYLELEGILLIEMGISPNKISRQQHLKNEISVVIKFTDNDGWYKSSIALNDDGTVDIILGGYLPLKNISKEAAGHILKPLVMYCHNREEFEIEYLS